MDVKAAFLMGALGLLSLTAGADAHEFKQQLDNLEERSRSMRIAEHLNNHFAAEGDLGARHEDGPKVFTLTVPRPRPAGMQLG